MNKILVAEDLGIVITGLKILLRAEFGNFHVDIVRNSTDLTSQLASEEYQIVIIDLQMEDEAIIQTVINILEQYKQLKVLVFSDNPVEIVAQPLYGLGIKGYLSKESDDEEIVAAINTILEGYIYMSEKMKMHLVKAVEEDTGDRLKSLSEAELKIILLLLKGKRVMDICAILNLKPSTISNAKKKIFQKLNVNSIAEVHRLMNQKNK